MIPWTDKSTRDEDYEEIEFEFVDPMRVLGSLWYYEEAPEDERWSLSLSVMDEAEQVHTATYRHSEATTEEAQQWAEDYIQQALRQWPSPLPEME